VLAGFLVDPLMSRQLHPSKEKKIRADFFGTRKKKGPREWVHFRVFLGSEEFYYDPAIKEGDDSFGPAFSNKV